jgi:hypothetical protein
MRCPLNIRSCTNVAAVFLMLGASHAQAGIVTSTFDTDTDGWTMFQNAGPQFGWIATGGNPGGHIGATDQTSDWAYVQAPAKFLAPAQYGGTLSFDLRVESLAQPVGFPGIFNVRVGLQGAGFTLINEGALPTLSWTNYSFTLDGTTGWRKLFPTSLNPSALSQNYSSSAPLATEAEMQAVLAGLTRLVIATDYTLASTDSNVPQVDRTYLDNVRLSTVDAVPEPSSLLMFSMGTCLAAISASRRRNRGLGGRA